MSNGSDRFRFATAMVATAAVTLLLTSCTPRPKDYWFKEDSTPVSGIKGSPSAPSHDRNGGGGAGGGGHH